MDNRTIDVVSEGRQGLHLALELMWPGVPGQKATHYRLCTLVEETRYYGEPTNRHHASLVENPDGVETLILLWGDEREATPLPYALDLEQTVEFVWGWLRQARRGKPMDHDGDNGAGWRVFTEAWGHVAGHHYAIVGVQPAWALYGK